jgi:hypothetical protein
MPLSNEDAEKINAALKVWRQGDVVLDSDLEFLHFADLSRPLSAASDQIASTPADTDEIQPGATPILDQVTGLVVLTQTCDIVRDCRKRPFVEVAPLIEVTADELNDIRRLKRPAFAYVPATAANRLIADLDRTMTVEKSLVADWRRVPGWETDGELRDFALALSRKRSRFAFPDDFVAAAEQLQERLAEKHHKQSEEGAHLRTLREIRVRAAPSWDISEQVQLSWWFIKDADPKIDKVDWPGWVEKWVKLFPQSGRFQCDPPTVCRLEDMTALDYVESDQLDLDRLSAPKGEN